MIWTALIQIFGYLAALKRGEPFGDMLKFYPEWQEEGVFIHINSESAKYIVKRFPGLKVGEYFGGYWCRTEEKLHKVKKDGAEVFVSIIQNQTTHIRLFRRQKPDHKRPYYSMLGVRQEIYNFFDYLIKTHQITLGAPKAPTTHNHQRR